MKIIVTDSKLENNCKTKLMENCFNNDAYLSLNDYDGLSTKDIEKSLKSESEKSVIVTADSRLLLFAHQYYGFNDLYIAFEGEIKNIKECISKELRIAHNLFKMYEAGAFKF